MDQSFSARPFHFNTVFEAAPRKVEFDFDEELSTTALRAEIIALRASRADDIAAAHARGAQEAETRIRAERDEALLAALDAVHAAWEEFADMREAMMEELRGQAGTLALSIGEVLAARALADAPGEAIDRAIGRVLDLIARGQEVVVNVHPDLIADIEAHMAERQARDRRRLNIVIEGDAALPPGDAHLRWEGGGQRLDAAARREAVEVELAGLIHSAPPAI